jgi:hypothetical protein
MGYSHPRYVSLAVQDTVLDATPERSVPRLPWRCPVCAATFRRWQDQRRHILTHLPKSLYCPEPDCCWRGDRPDSLIKHWWNDHPSSSGQEPDNSDKGQFTIYEPEPLVEGLLNGSISIQEAQTVAKLKVKIRAEELGKLRMWGSLWGRRLKRCKRYAVIFILNFDCL